MSQSDIRKALEIKLAALPGGWPIAYENDGFIPVKGTSWLKSTLLISSVTPITAGPKGYNRWIGYLQVSVFVDAKKGPGAADAKVDSLMLHFSKGLVLTQNSKHIQIEQASSSKGPSEPDWFSLIVFIPWFANIMD